MNITIYNKLVRDRIPEVIEASGKTCNVVVLDDVEYLHMLDAKMDEELKEYHEDKSIEELADLLEVIYAAVIARGYIVEELDCIRRKKAEKHGVFSNRLFLTKVIEYGNGEI